MLDYIRRQNIGIKVVLGLVVLSFIIFYAGSFSGLDRRDPSRNMGAVGNQEINFVEFQNMVNLIEQQQRQFFGDREMSSQMIGYMRQQAIQTLVDRKLMMMEARKANVKASEEEIRRAILNSPYFTNNGNFVGMDEYTRRVEAVFHMDIGDFEKTVGEDVVLNKYNDLLTAGILVSDKEIEDQYRKNSLTAKIDYVLFEAPAVEQIQVTPEEARAYYDSHKNEFSTGELRKVQYLWVSHESEKNRVQIPDAKLREYYDSNKERYSRPEQVRARHILLKTEGKDDAAVKAQAEDIVKQLRGGADFAEMARKYSEDEGSKASGGDLGLFSRGRMVPEFEQAAFSMPVNQISDPVKSQFGYHIIQVTEKQPAFQMEFGLVKDQIYRELSLPQSTKNAEEQAKRVYGEIKNNKKSMPEISRLQFVELRNSDFFARNEDLPGLSPAFREAAFSLKRGDVSQPVQVFQDYAILQLVDTKASEIPPFEKVQAKVSAKVRQQKRDQLANEKAQQFYNSLAGSADLKAAADKEKLTVKTSDAFSKGGYVGDLGNPPEISEQAFNMQKGQISKPVKTAAGYVVYQLKEKKDFDPAELAKQKDQLRQQILSEKQGAFLQAYRSMLRQKYQKEIWINEEAVRPKET